MRQHKKNFLSKLLAVALSLIMMASMLPVTVAADEWYEENAIPVTTADAPQLGADMTAILGIPGVASALAALDVDLEDILGYSSQTATQFDAGGGTYMPTHPITSGRYNMSNSVVYSPALTPNTGGIIQYNFVFTPTAQVLDTGETARTIEFFLVPEGFTGATTMVNLRTAAPIRIDFRSTVPGAYPRESNMEIFHTTGAAPRPRVNWTLNQAHDITITIDTNANTYSVDVYAGGSRVGGTAMFPLRTGTQMDFSDGIGALHVHFSGNDSSFAANLTVPAADAALGGGTTQPTLPPETDTLYGDYFRSGAAIEPWPLPEGWVAPPAGEEWTANILTLDTPAAYDAIEITFSIRMDSDELFDGTVGFGPGTAGAGKASYAILLRFDPDGLFTVWDGPGYVATDVPWSYLGGDTHHFRIVADLENATYDIYVAFAGDTNWTRLGYDLAFRATAGTITELSRVHFASDTLHRAYTVGNLNFAETTAPVRDPATGTQPGDLVNIFGTGLRWAAIDQAFTGPTNTAPGALRHGGVPIFFATSGTPEINNAVEALLDRYYPDPANRSMTATEALGLLNAWQEELMFFVAPAPGRTFADVGLAGLNPNDGASDGPWMWGNPNAGLRGRFEERGADTYFIVYGTVTPPTVGRFPHTRSGEVNVGHVPARLWEHPDIPHICNNDMPDFELYLGDGMYANMVYIPAGGQSALLGSPFYLGVRFQDEHPYIANFSRSFYMMEVPVTNAMWEAAMGQPAPAAPDAQWGGADRFRNLQNSDPNHPASFAPLGPYPSRAAYRSDPNHRSYNDQNGNNINALIALVAEENNLFFTPEPPSANRVLSADDLARLAIILEDTDYEASDFAHPGALPPFELRLPSDAEWEFAARSGTSNPAYTARYHEMGVSTYINSQPVRTGAASPWGLYDMMSGGWERVTTRKANNIRNVGAGVTDYLGPRETNVQGNAFKAKGGYHRWILTPHMHGAIDDNENPSGHLQEGGILVFRLVIWGADELLVREGEESVISVAVTPQTTSVMQGATQQFEATVVAFGGATRDVVWSIDGAANANTTISANGLLEIYVDEPTSSVITVTATSVFDADIYGTATVTVRDIMCTINTLSFLRVNGVDLIASESGQTEFTMSIPRGPLVVQTTQPTVAGWPPYPILHPPTIDSTPSMLVEALTTSTNAQAMVKRDGAQFGVPAYELEQDVTLTILNRDNRITVTVTPEDPLSPPRVYTITIEREQGATSNRVFHVGRGQNTADDFESFTALRAYLMARPGSMGQFSSMIPGESIYVYPNICAVTGRNLPHFVSENGRVFLNASGTEYAPITLRGIIDADGNRPIIGTDLLTNSTVGSGLRHSILTIGASPAWGTYAGDWVIVEDLIIDGGILDLLDFFNVTHLEDTAQANHPNRFVRRFGMPPAPAFSETLTLENLPLFINAVFEEEWFRGDTVGGIALGGSYGTAAPASTPANFMGRNNVRNLFPGRAILIEGGDNVTIRNVLAMGGGTGIHGGDSGPGTMLLDGVEVAYAGMGAAGHNIYFNGDPILHPHMTITVRNSFVHHSIGTQGLRTRAGRNIIYNNFFLNNAAKQFDLVGFDAGTSPENTHPNTNPNITPGAGYMEMMGNPDQVGMYASAQIMQGFVGMSLPHWLSLFDLPQDSEFIGNVSMYYGWNSANHVHIGGAGKLWEESWGRYRFLNNTFVHLSSGSGGAPQAIRARFGIESVEIYNNVFYRRAGTFVPFDEESNMVWKHGTRQVQGSNNWICAQSTMTGGSNSLPIDLNSIFTNTIRGAAGQHPFVSLAGHDTTPGNVLDLTELDLRIAEGSSAEATGVPVSTTATFMSYAEYTARFALCNGGHPGIPAAVAAASILPPELRLWGANGAAVPVAPGSIPNRHDWLIVDGVLQSIGNGCWNRQPISTDSVSRPGWRGSGFHDMLSWSGGPHHLNYVTQNISTPPMRFVSTTDGFRWENDARTDSNLPQLGAFLTGIADDNGNDNDNDNDNDDCMETFRIDKDNQYANIVYDNPIMPNTDNIIEYSFVFDPVRMNDTTGPDWVSANPLEVFILPVGYTGRVETSGHSDLTGANNLRMNAPIRLEFRHYPPWASIHATHGTSNNNGHNLGDWLLTNTYDVLVRINVQTDQFQIVLTPVGSANPSHTTPWLDLRTTGGTGGAAWNVSPQNRDFTGGIGGVHIRLMGDGTARGLIAADFTLPGNDCYEAPPQPPTFPECYEYYHLTSNANPVHVFQFVYDTPIAAQDGYITHTVIFAPTVEAAGPAPSPYGNTQMFQMFLLPPGFGNMPNTPAEIYAWAWPPAATASNRVHLRFESLYTSPTNQFVANVGAGFPTFGYWEVGNEYELLFRINAATGAVSVAVNGGTPTSLGTTGLREIGEVRVLAYQSGGPDIAAWFAVPGNDCDEEPTPPFALEIGPDRYFRDLRDFQTRHGFNNLQPGDTVLIFPNTNNEPYLTPTTNWGVNIEANGLPGQPITIRGVVCEYTCARPIILAPARTTSSVLSIAGNYVIVENVVVDGGLYDFLDFLNGNAPAGSRAAARFGVNTTNEAFPGSTLTYENFISYIDRFIENPFFHVATSMWVIPVRNSPRDVMRFHRNQFASRGIAHRRGNNVEVRNVFVTASGTGLHGFDFGPGNILVCSSEFGFNGTGDGGHNLYFNGCNLLFPNLEVIVQNSFIHNAIYSQGLRTRVGRTILLNNFFLNNAAKQIDLVGYDAGYPGDNFHFLQSSFNNAGRPAHWESVTAFRQDNEMIGNVSIYTELFPRDHVGLGGAGKLWENTYGRYRFVNNTFIALAYGWGDGHPQLVFQGRFGMESVELYNNIFYASNPHRMAVFFDHLNPARALSILEMGGYNDDGTPFLCPTEFDPTNFRQTQNMFNRWSFGERQVAGANNWFSHGMINNQMPMTIAPPHGAPGNNHYFVWNAIPSELTGTIIGEPGEIPFVNLPHNPAATPVDISAFDLNVRDDSTANVQGSPVGSVAEFMTQEEFNRRYDEGLLPIIWDWRFDENGNQIAQGFGDWTDPEVWSSHYTFARWRDLTFTNPTSVNPNNAISPLGVGLTPDCNWFMTPRTDHAAPTLGAFANPTSVPPVPPTPPVFGWDIFNNGQGGTQYPNPNHSLAEAGLIRMRTQLDGADALVYFAAANTITALDQDGECAMEFVHVHRIWCDTMGWQNYFMAVDVNKNGDWQFINFEITVFDRTVPVLLVNALFEEPADDITVTFVVEAGAVGVYAAVTSYIELLAGETIPTDAIPSTVARTGFYFAGWYPSDPATFGYVTEDVTFTARFNPLFHNVTFEAGNGGELVAGSFGLVVSIRDGFAFWADRVPTPVADYGYEFVEWTPYNPAGFVVRGDITFTAVFAPVIVTPVEPRIVSVTPVPVVVEQGSTVEITVTTQGMPDGAWVDLTVAWRPGLSIIGGPRFYIVNNQAVITVAATATAPLGRDGFSVAARVAGDWGSVVILDSYAIVIEVQ